MKEFEMKQKVLSLLAVICIIGMAACVRIPTEPMITGVRITDEQMQRVVDNKTSCDDLIRMIGHPQRQNQIGEKTLWYYDFTQIGQSLGGKNISETAVFEISKKNIITSHYKTAGSGGSSSNALLKAAGQ